MEKSNKVNPKLIGFCLVALLGGLFLLNPFEKKETEITEPPEQNIEDTINPELDSELNPVVNIPEILSFNMEELKGCISSDYIQTMEDILNAKNVGMYSNYVDKNGYISNPYYQKYTFSKENNEQDSDIKKYPNAYNGSYASKDDYSSSNPSGTSNNEPKPEEEKPKEPKPEQPKPEEEKPEKPIN